MSWGLISAMGHVSIQTDRFEASVDDAVTTLGLRETAREAGVSYLTAGQTHHWLPPGRTHCGSSVGGSMRKACGS